MGVSATSSMGMGGIDPHETLRQVDRILGDALPSFAPRSHEGIAWV